MKTDDPKITKLQAKVTAAQQEFDLAVAFHEIWKPTAYDRDLHGRLGVSYATQAFRVIRTALRRELILALIRLWDKDGRAIGMECIARALAKKEVIDALTLARVDQVSEDFDAMRDDLRKKADEAILLVDKYMSGGASHAVYKKLRDLRNERLAHRQVVTKVRATGATATDEEIEEFYQDNSKLVHILLGIFNAMAYDPEDAAKVFGFYASHFWGRFQVTEVKHESKTLRQNGT
jgi:AbiU2